MRSIATVLAFAASALAYTVVAPTNATGFVNDGSNTVSWSRVSTDAMNFTILLVNQHSFPTYSQSLAALVDGTLNSIQVNPPSTGWPANGYGYQINLVQDTEHLSTIFAQSEQFTIHDPIVSSGSHSASSTSSTTALTLPATFSSSPTSSAPSSPTGGSGSDQGSPSASDTSVNPAQTNAASPAAGMQAAFFGVVALVGAMLA
jgi:hypothetical protein